MQAGTLEGDSAIVLGKGNVYVSGGTLISDAAGTASVAGTYQLPGSTLELHLENAQGRMVVGGNALISSGILNVVYTPAPPPVPR